MGKAHYFQETTLNQCFGEFRGANIASLLLTELNPYKLFQPRYVLIRNTAGTELFQFGTGPSTNSYVDFHPRPSNNPRMPRPDAVRRVKSYSAADGYVYQYYFFEGDRAQRNGAPGGEFTYVVSADRKSAFPFKIFVKQSALEAWANVNGRSLTSSEEYAVAKMRLFQAFDEGLVKPSPDGQQPGEVLVDESNLEEMLGRLGI
jgi:hypothetical protein